MRRPRHSRSEKRSRPLKLEALEERLAPAGVNLHEQVADLYRLQLNREPNPAGLNHYVAQLRQGAPLAKVARSIMSSPEYHQRVVTGFFQNCLDRAPTSRELTRFTRALDRGTSEEKVLARMFSTVPDLTDQQYVSFLHDKILKREPDALDMANHLLKLEAGVSRYATALSLIESPEFSAKITTAIFRHVYESEPEARELAVETRRLTRVGYGFSDAFVRALSSPRGQQVVGQKSNALMALPPNGTDSSAALFGITATMYPGAAVDTSAAVADLVNQIRAVETFSNPTNKGQITSGLRPNEFPDPKARNDDTVATTGTNGLDAYSGDGRNTPGAFQVDLANLHQRFGLWAGQAGSLKNQGPSDTQIAFSRATLTDYLGIEVDTGGFITRIDKVAASVFLHNEAIALDDSFDPLHNSLIGLNIDNFQSEQLSLYLAGRSPLDPTVAMASDTRVAPQALLDMDAELQGAAARSFIWNSFNDLYFRSSSQFNPTYLKAVELFGSTMRITGSTGAFGVDAGIPFLCQFNPGFIIGGGYVKGFSSNGGVFDIVQAVVEADENGTATFDVTDAQGTLGPLEIALAGGAASGVAVTGNDMGYIGFAPDQTTETYRISVVTAGDYGTARLSVASDSGQDTPTGLVTPVAGVPVKIGSRGLTLTFNGGSFTAGAQWTAKVTQVSQTKTITITRSVEGGVKVFSVDRTPVNVNAQYPSLFHYGAIMSVYPVDMGAGDWDVDQASYDHGYSSNQVAVNVTDTMTAPAGQGSYGVTYRALGDGRTLTLTGNDTYHVAPFVEHDPTEIVIKVDNTGYGNGGNNNQNVGIGNRIDMSAYGTAMVSAYPNFFYVYTSPNLVDVAKHVSDPTVPSNVGLRLYYIPAANGSVATAQQAVTNGDFSDWSPYKASYRVNLANKAVLGTPMSAADWGTHFIMTPPPPPPMGTGVIDASSAFGSLFLKVDNSIAVVKLGSGSNSVVGSTVNTPVTYVLNPVMAAGVARSSFAGLRYGADRISLREFTNVTNLQVVIGPSFDNRSNSAAIQDFYNQFSSSAVVSFDSDVSGSTEIYTFRVLLDSRVERTSAQWQTMVNSSIEAS